jgi:hypothetical protein
MGVIDFRFDVLHLPRTFSEVVPGLRCRRRGLQCRKASVLIDSYCLKTSKRRFHWGRFLFIGEIDTSIETVVRDFRTGGRFAHMEHTNFYVGQKVYDEALFPGVEGEVKEIKEYRTHVFFIGEFFSYNENGAISSKCVPTLFPEPYEVRRPEVLPEPGTFVYCWDGEVEKLTTLSCGYFAGIGKNKKYQVKAPSETILDWDHIALENPFPKKIEL